MSRGAGQLLKAFVLWCQDEGLQALPAAPDTVALYLTHLAASGRKVVTIERALVSVSQAHKTAGAESPRSTAPVQGVMRGIRLSIAGGGYFRLLPLSLLKSGLHSILDSQRPAVVYCHPYEFNDSELNSYRSEVSPFFRFSQGVGRTRFVELVRNLLHAFPFGRFDHVLEEWGIVGD